MLSKHGHYLSRLISRVNISCQFWKLLRENSHLVFATSCRCCLVDMKSTSSNIFPSTTVRLCVYGGGESKVGKRGNHIEAAWGKVMPRFDGFRSIGKSGLYAVGCWCGQFQFVRLSCAWREVGRCSLDGVNGALIHQLSRISRRRTGATCWWSIRVRRWVRVNLASWRVIRKPGWLRKVCRGGGGLSRAVACHHVSSAIWNIAESCLDFLPFKSATPWCRYHWSSTKDDQKSVRVQCQMAG